MKRKLGNAVSGKPKLILWSGTTTCYLQLRTPFAFALRCLYVHKRKRAHDTTAGVPPPVARAAAALSRVCRCGVRCSCAGLVQRRVSGLDARRVSLACWRGRGHGGFACVFCGDILSPGPQVVEAGL